MPTRKLILILSLTFLYFFSSCGEKSGMELSLNERAEADSLYVLQLDSIDAVLDSICIAQYDSLYQKSYNQLLEKRIKAIRKLYADEK